MSMVMDAAMEAWDRGLSTIPDKQLCGKHIADYAIRRFIKRTGQKGQCDYCGNTRVVIQLDTLLYFITDALLHFYTDPANFMSYDSSEGGYLGEVEGPWEMLENLGLNIPDKILWDDLYNSFDHATPWADQQSALSDFKYEGWLHFKHIVKHQSRFLFIGKEEFRVGHQTITARDFLKQIIGDIRRQRMLTQIPTGTALYRCRQHLKMSEVAEASDICAPKAEHAVNPNRMSPAGIAMFYGALNAETAKLETFDRSDRTKPFLSQAIFTPKEDLLLIDLSKIPVISPFDQENWELYDRVEFLRRFLREFSAPISRDSYAHIEYVPTQIITEFLRYNFKRRDGKKIDGIIYPSSKNRSLNALVLFMDHYECLKRLDFDTSNLVQEKVIYLK
ncbi:RES domain-containing protein [Flavobacterium sp. Sd200]|uniref:HEPN-associated N-terminal domain-containing protein n=1 Tax=Flavobacterium sp. Sd200 TaxID=2692211 RepID=UPI0013688D5B|nr:HEPN-associated N-terminal domain-containing protein [Flavobacterium sp. Sd200]MXN91108.1 RES domain-containing protein [Flavobacterium sp. Sd200]